VWDRLSIRFQHLRRHDTLGRARPLAHQSCLDRRTFAPATQTNTRPISRHCSKESRTESNRRGFSILLSSAARPLPVARLVTSWDAAQSSTPSLSRPQIADTNFPDPHGLFRHGRQAAEHIRHVSRLAVRDHSDHHFALAKSARILKLQTDLNHDQNRRRTGSSALKKSLVRQAHAAGVALRSPMQSERRTLDHSSLSPRKNTHTTTSPLKNPQGTGRGTRFLSIWRMILFLILISSWLPWLMFNRNQSAPLENNARSSRGIRSRPRAIFDISRAFHTVSPFTFCGFVSPAALITCGLTRAANQSG